MFQQISRIDKEKYDNDHEEALADIDHEYRGVWGEMHKIFFGIEKGFPILATLHVPDNIWGSNEDTFQRCAMNAGKNSE